MLIYCTFNNTVSISIISIKKENVIDSLSEKYLKTFGLYPVLKLYSFHLYILDSHVILLVFLRSESRPLNKNLRTNLLTMG